METLYNEPPSVRAGDSVAWKIDDADYPPTAGWTLYYALRNSAGAIDITAGADGGSFLVSKAASQTTGWTAGIYTWQRFVVKGVDRYTRGAGSISILPNFSGTTNYDARTDARKIYDDLITAYKSAVSSGLMQSFSIGGKSVTYKSTKEIIDQIEHWRRIVEQEDLADKIANGFANPRRVGVRLVKI